MITYYRDPAVQVTSDALRVDGTAYPLAELARVWHRRGRTSWRAVAGRGALGLAMLVPLALGAAGLAAALTLDLAPMNTLAVALAAALVGLGVAPLADVLLEFMDRSYARGSQAHEIWALRHGQPVLILRTGDALRFGKVYRALQRALEQPQAAHR
ncbi:MAG TPA: DUF6232 family protein [Pilimelia sp.]|nr:DUF6232 family protein [Pilimelia sp.]